MVFQLGSRIERDPQKPRKLPPALLASSFNDIRRNGHRRTRHLTAQRGVTTGAHRRRSSIDMHRQRVSFAPNAELLEIAHSARSTAPPTQATSFVAPHRRIAPASVRTNLQPPTYAPLLPPARSPPLLQFCEASVYRDAALPHRPPPGNSDLGCRMSASISLISRGAPMERFSTPRSVMA